MWYTNTLRFEMVNKDSAVKALDAIKEILSTSDINNEYKGIPSIDLMNDLMVDGKIITLKEGGLGYFIPEDSMKIYEELVRNVVANCGDSFKEFMGYAYSDYDEADIEAKNNNVEIIYKTTYYPAGYCESIYCNECDAEIAIECHVPGERIICPKCGKNITEAFESCRPKINTTKIK